VGQRAGLDRPADPSGAANGRGRGEIAKAPRIELPEAPLLTQARHRHVHELAVAERAQPHRALGRVGVALDRPRPLPLGRCGEPVGGERRALEIRDAAPCPREERHPGPLHLRPGALADALLGGEDGGRTSDHGRQQLSSGRM
jgi:hypothetical protein